METNNKRLLMSYKIGYTWYKWSKSKVNFFIGVGIVFNKINKEDRKIYIELSNRTTGTINQKHSIYIFLKSRIIKLVICNIFSCQGSNFKTLLLSLISKTLRGVWYN